MAFLVVRWGLAMTKNLGIKREVQVREVLVTQAHKLPPIAGAEKAIPSLWRWSAARGSGL